MYRLILVILSVSLLNSASADSTGAIAVDYFKVNSTYLTVYIDKDYSVKDSPSCISDVSETPAVVIERSRDDFKELYAAIMLGFSTNKKLGFWLDGSCSTNTQGGPFPISTMVYVYSD
ncbi:hypothetical protein [Paraglaciecola marina]|uniref:hypothetical protein n=1 Tax=Paraglaciecola marina TaxID=2500157 RepID=UPI00105BEFF0|nr:hypothetical protein [Paraglaciecola marina]